MTRRILATVLAAAALFTVGAATAEAKPADRPAEHWTWTG